ncbi:MAG TPA: ATP-binding protein [Oligoflexus sp.]|uniref:hybrid sensor histidine kinase/response regulator n=1 Tax=Oligoflexus sp. TaxID=1971216 RepID=UPI002D6BF77A|nr:ATP-binding protein [Oligoflexus sp.]HYX31912.1 ATP-binding protein [Oligoflexus sp.]
MSEVENVESPLTRRSLILLVSLMAASLLPTVGYLGLASSHLTFGSSASMLPLALALSPILMLPLLTLLTLASRIPGAASERSSLYGFMPCLLLAAYFDAFSFLSLKDSSADAAGFLHSEQINAFSRSFALCLVTLLALKSHRPYRLGEGRRFWIMPLTLASGLCGLQFLDLRLGVFMDYLPTIVGITCLTAIFNIAFLTKIGWEKQRPLMLTLGWMSALQLVNQLLFLFSRPESLQVHLLLTQNINDVLGFLVPLPFLAGSILKQMTRPVSSLPDANHFQAIQGLNSAEAFAQGVAQAKAQLMSKLSHEFKTPLNTIIGYSELLVDELEHSQQTLLSDDLHKVNRAGWYLMTLVDDLLDVCSLDGNGFKPHETLFDAERFMQILKRMADKIATPHLITIECFCQKDFGTVYADESRLLQVCMNVLRNAVRYTSKGSISLHFYSIIQDGKRFFTIDIRDSGHGMDSTQLAQIFAPFESIQNDSREGIYGLSLGLPVTKRLCEMMGGTLLVDSSPGMGTTFSLTFPHKSNTQEPRNEKRKAALPVGPVLLIDDDEEYTGFVQEIFESAGMQTFAVTKARSGLRIYLEKRPSVIVVDLKMPDIDGYSVIQSIRDQDPDCLIITVSGEGMDSSEERSLALGSDQFFEKPMAIEAVLRTIENRRVVEDGDQAKRA